MAKPIQSELDLVFTSQCILCLSNGWFECWSWVQGLCSAAAAFLGSSVARAPGSCSGMSQAWSVLWWLKDPGHKEVEMCV